MTTPPNTYDVVVHVSFVYRITAENEDEVRAIVAGDLGSLGDYPVVDVYDGPDVRRITPAKVTR